MYDAFAKVDGGGAGRDAGDAGRGGTGDHREEEFGLIRNRRLRRALARFRRDVLGGWQFHGHQAGDRGGYRVQVRPERPGRLLRTRLEHLLRHLPGALHG